MSSDQTRLEFLQERLTGLYADLKRIPGGIASTSGHGLSVAYERQKLLNEIAGVEAQIEKEIANSEPRIFDCTYDSR